MYTICVRCLLLGVFRKLIAVVGAGTFRTYNQGHPQRRPVEVVHGFEKLRQLSLDALDVPVVQQEDQPGDGKQEDDIFVFSLRRIWQLRFFLSCFKLLTIRATSGTLSRTLPNKQHNMKQHTTKQDTPAEIHSRERNNTEEHQRKSNQIHQICPKKIAGWDRGKYSDKNDIEATTYRRKLWVVPRKNLTAQDLQEFRAFKVESVDVGSGVRERGVSGV